MEEDGIEDRCGLEHAGSNRRESGPHRGLSEPPCVSRNDLAVAMKVYAMAREKKLGRELPLWSDASSS